MRYWDASALVPLLVAEQSSESVRQLLREDDHVITWAWTRTEMVSAIERRARENSLPRDRRCEILDRLTSFAATWDEIDDVSSVRSRAIRVLARHPLRSADAGQLGAALLIQEQLNETLDFVCLDSRLCNAAELEGLHVMPEPSGE